MVVWLLAARLGIQPAPTDEAADRPLLEWIAPAACPDQRRVDARLQQLIPGERAESLVARAEVTAVDERYRLRVELVSASGNTVRELEAESCAVLLEAAVFIVAVAIDPAIATAAMTDAAAPVVAQDEPAPAEEAVLAPIVADAREPVPVVPRDTPRPSPAPTIGGALRAGLAVGTGEVSRLDFAPSLWGAVKGRFWRAELGVRYVAGRPVPIEGDPEASLALDAVGGVLRGCGVAPAGPLELPICAGLDLAGVRGHPSGVLGPRDRFALRVAVDLAVALAWPITPRVALWVEATGSLAVLRPNFVVRGVPSPILGPIAAIAALVGVELRLGPGARAR